ncbi:SDR family oxidoreductase [Nocardia sp. CA2R105]|uniref:SDR family NAD(P)-dependent oxidoreductase n=1 Tax=Nocardia coffeae TaxID=2873381 RepID=UPI001CA60F31|nr:SDR family oxidoreductase [Nocardia coffeae]MBY8858662.1 SDR family oxidoreductase [Nocardia coffeae]
MITGAASGIGQSVAELAADSGASLTLIDVDQASLGTVAASVRDRATVVKTVVADLADPRVPETVVATAVTAMGGIDALISNAGMAPRSSLLDLTVGAFDLSVAVNTRATWLLGKAAHPWLSRSEGAVVATASITGHQPTTPIGAYATAKAGLLMLVKQMALEWGPDGIRCCTVSPGPTITGMTAGLFNDDNDPTQRAMRKFRESHLPLRKLGRAEEVARAVLFLASPAASQITGVDLLVDGGLSLALMSAAGGWRPSKEDPTD